MADVTVTRKDLQSQMYQRMTDAGYQDLTSFARQTRLTSHLSFETVRRSFNESDKPVHPASLALVLRCLGYTYPEIRANMINLGDTIYHTLLPEQGAVVEPWEAGVVGAVRRIASTSRQGLKAVQLSLQAVAAAVGLDISDDAALIDRSYTKASVGKPGVRNLVLD